MKEDAVYRDLSGNTITQTIHILTSHKERRQQMDLKEYARFSVSEPIKTDIIKTAGSNIVIVCLEEGQVIPPHPEPYAVVFVVLEGEGIITSGTVEHEVKPMHLVSVGKDENRGIQCIKQMTLLGIREDV